MERVRNISIVRIEETSLLEEEAFSLRGHDVPCRFCGRKLSEHVLADDADLAGDPPIEDWLSRWSRYRMSLWECPGFVPKNLRLWDKREAAYQKER